MVKITIVDEYDNIIGAAERSEARAKGLRHRIVRVFLINTAGQILLQKRSPRLVDSPDKWDQSAGGHVDEGEDYLAAARRETYEELGIQPAEFTTIGKFYIERRVPGGIARRFQTVFMARWDDEVEFDSEDVAAVQWFSLSEIAALLQANPEDFTKNFPGAFTLLQKYLAK